MFKIKVLYRRENILKYLSHLDLIRTFYRLIRRVNLPVIYSRGYTPRPRLSFSSPVKTGVLPCEEFFIVYLTKKLSEDYILKIMEEKSPPGIKIKEVLYI